MEETAVLDLIRSLPGAEQSSHLGTMDFRMKGRIFATHHRPEAINLNLMPEQQEMLIETTSGVFSRLPNKRGDSGWTAMDIAAVDPTTALSALTMAHGNQAVKPPARPRKPKA